jgi:hypothetical protein
MPAVRWHANSNHEPHLISFFTVRLNKEQNPRLCFAPDVFVPNISAGKDCQQTSVTVGGHQASS